MPIMLTSEGLTIRTLLPKDLHDLLDYLTLPEIAEFQYVGPMSPEQVQHLIAASRIMNRWDDTTYYLGVEYEEHIIGDFQLTISSPEHRQGDVGFSFNPAYGGRGLATHAMSLILGIGFKKLQMHKINSACFTTNERSWQLMERVGMRREGHFIHDGLVRGEWRDSYSYGILDDEWIARYPDLESLIVDV